MRSIGVCMLTWGYSSRWWCDRVVEGIVVVISHRLQRNDGYAGSASRAFSGTNPTASPVRAVMASFKRSMLAIIVIST